MNDFALGAFALLVTCAAVPGMRSLAWKFKITDVPSPGHPHERSTPKLGGIAIVGGFLVALAVSSGLELWLTVCVVAMLAVGLFDDIREMRPGHKLAAQVVIAAIFALTARNLGLPGWPWLTVAGTIFWLVATCNSFNLIDGLDGLASGIGIVACAAVAVTAIVHGDERDAGAALAMGGALAGFFLYNLRPASIFMGDGGALTVGFLLGVISLRVAARTTNSVIAAYVFPLFIMMVPLLDTIVVTVSRLATGRSISVRGVDHSHHRLLSLGLPYGFAVSTFWAVELLAAGYAVAASLMPHAFVIVSLPLICVAMAPYSLFLIDLTFESIPPGIAYTYVGGISRTILQLGYRLRLVDMALDLIVVTASYFSTQLLQHNLAMSDFDLRHAVSALPDVAFLSGAALFVAGIYHGMWRFLGLADVLRLARGAALAGSVMIAASLLSLIPLTPSSAILFTVLLFDLLVATRGSFRLLRRMIRPFTAAGERIVIVGANEEGEAIAQQIVGLEPRRQLIGFIDDDRFKHGKRIGGWPVLGPIESLASIRETCKFEAIVIASAKLDDGRLTFLRDFATQHGVRLSRCSVQWQEMVPRVRPAAEVDARNNAPVSVSRTDSEVAAPLIVGAGTILRG